MCELTPSCLLGNWQKISFWRTLLIPFNSGSRIWMLTRCFFYREALSYRKGLTQFLLAFHQSLCLLPGTCVHLLAPDPLQTQPQGQSPWHSFAEKLWCEQSYGHQCEWSPCLASGDKPASSGPHWYLTRRLQEQKWNKWRMLPVNPKGGGNKQQGTMHETRSPVCITSVLPHFGQVIKEDENKNATLLV